MTLNPIVVLRDVGACHQRGHQKANWVVNLAGVNRPKDPDEFREGNFGFASKLLDTLKKYGNKCPVMLSSSLQATLAGRFGEFEYRTGFCQCLQARYYQGDALACD